MQYALLRFGLRSMRSLKAEYSTHTAPNISHSVLEKRKNYTTLFMKQ